MSYVSIWVYKTSICRVYRKGTNSSEAVVCGKFSRRRHERRELASFSYFLFSLIALRMWMKSESRERWWDEFLSARRIFISILRDETALMLVVAIRVFALKSVWLSRRLIVVISLSCHRKFLKPLAKEQQTTTGVHFLKCQKGTRGLWFWPLTLFAHWHACASTVWGSGRCSSFTSRLGMERAGVLLSLRLPLRAVSALSLVLTSTVTALQIQKVKSASFETDTCRLQKASVCVCVFRCLWICVFYGLLGNFAPKHVLWAHFNSDFWSNCCIFI